MSDTAVAGRRGRTGGGAARRAERTAVHIDKAPAITRAIPNFELLGDDVLATIEANAAKITIWRQASVCAPNASSAMRDSMTTAATLGALAKKAVTGVGAPS